MQMVHEIALFTFELSVWAGRKGQSGVTFFEESSIRIQIFKYF